MRHRTAILSSLFVAAGLFAAGGASAKACHDSSGKFIKCAVTPSTTGGRCKDASGKFAKCSAPGAMPVTVAAAATAKPSPTAITKPTATATAAKPK